MQVIEKYNDKILVTFNFSQLLNDCEKNFEYDHNIYWAGELECLPDNLIGHYGGCRWYYLNKKLSIFN